MPRLAVLHLEDNPLDAELVSAQLVAARFDCDVTRVDTREGFVHALDHGTFDVILADYSLPSFDGMGALEIVRQRRLDVPFLFVSGAIGEERAIESLKAGATDYILKDRLGRLGPSLSRALREAHERRQRQHAEAELRRLNENLEKIVAQRTAELQQRQQQLRRLASELTLAERRERRHLAQTLHDDLAQPLLISKMKLALIRPTEDCTRPLGEIDATLGQAIEFTRTLIDELYPPTLYDLGLDAAIDWLVETMHQQHGLAVHVQDDGQPKPLSDDVRTVLFRALRELLLNVCKHSGASTAHVRYFRQNDHAVLAVQDRGLGFDPRAVAARPLPHGGMGLFTIRERLDLLGGSVKIDSAPGQGATITLTAPLATAPSPT